MNTTVFDSPAFTSERLSYRKPLVDMLNATFDPEIQRATNDIAKWTDEMNALQKRIDDAKKYIAEIRQLQKHAGENADLPGGVGLPLLSVTCRTCGLPIVKTADGRWVHTGRELLDRGDRCSPDDKDSPLAEPAKGPGQAFGDWAGAIDEERAGGLS